MHPLHPVALGLDGVEEDLVRGGAPPVEEIGYTTFSGRTPFAGTSLQGLIFLSDYIFTPTYSYLISAVSHELAHLWWSGGDPHSWEDWLNESFAEYSAFLYLRARGENEMFMAYLGDYEQMVDYPPVLWGMDLDHKYAHDTLHRKGPGMLFRLEMEVGYVEFMKFMAALGENDVTTTKELLSVLEKTTSKEARDRFEGYLKGP